MQKDREKIAGPVHRAQTYFCGEKKFPPDPLQSGVQQYELHLYKLGFVFHVVKSNDSTFVSEISERSFRKRILISKFCDRIFCASTITGSSLTVVEEFC